MKTLQEKIDLVKNDILTRFPNCFYTISILLWDDGTDSVECRHGDDDCKKLYTSTYYNNELTFQEIDIDGKVLIKDKFGFEKFMYLSENKTDTMESLFNEIVEQMNGKCDEKGDSVYIPRILAGKIRNLIKKK